MKIEKIKRQNSFISNGKYRNRRITSDFEYRMDEQFKNLLSFEILVVFQIEKILKF